MVTAFLDGLMRVKRAPWLVIGLWLSTLLLALPLSLALHALIGEHLGQSMAAQAAAVGLGIRQSGPPQMPTLLFDDDPDCTQGYRFCQEALKRGVYLHPRHNMFLSMAHSDADIDEALQATAQALEVLASGR